MMRLQCQQGQPHRHFLFAWQQPMDQALPPQQAGALQPAQHGVAQPLVQRVRAYHKDHRTKPSLHLLAFCDCIAGYFFN
jgi:hypothetical protein